jgi:hypothetical protein
MQKPAAGPEVPAVGGWGAAAGWESSAAVPHRLLWRSPSRRGAVGWLQRTGSRMIPTVRTEASLESLLPSGSEGAGAPPPVMTPSSSDGGLAALEELRAAIGPRYDIKGELGRGTGGIVYLAYDLERKESVALKVLRDHLDPVGIARFRREIEIGTKLRHARIVSLLDSGSVGSRPYYVMQRILGPSLKDRLSDERQLAMKDVFAIAAQAAEALDHAHANQVVHRDIKPANILLGASGALVADFGIAQLRLVPGDSLTDSGLSIGTPQYMSPEQAAGQHTIDGRADIYGLACVVYEMIGGQPPFTGATAQAVMAQHMNEQPRSLRVVRPNISLAADAAIMKALSKVPADRFATAGEFAEALARPDSRLSGAVHRVSAATRGWGFRIGVAAAAVLSAVIAKASLRGADVDPNRFALVPVRANGTIPASIRVDRGLQDVLTRWTGVRVIEVDSSSVPAANSETSLRRLGRSTRAAIVLSGEVSAVGDSATIRVIAVHTASEDLAPRIASRTVPLEAAIPDSVFSSVVDDLLFGDVGPGVRSMGRVTRSLDARRAFLEGQVHLLSWDLAEADSAFSRAMALDAEYAAAGIWLASARWWSRAAVARWRAPLAQAGARPRGLDITESAMARALTLVAEEHVPEGCAKWGELADASPFAPFLWYSAAACLRGDSAVVRSTTSPSGWTFRSSYAEALRRYRQAFRLLPAILQADRSDSYLSVRRLFFVSARELRSGRAVAPDTGRFVARAEWVGDSLAFVPWRTRDFQIRPARTPMTESAVMRQRRLFGEIATTWSTQYPASAAALEAVALTLELDGDPAAIDTLRRARSLASGPEDALRSASAEVWLRLKFLVADPSAPIEPVRALADSILRWWPADTGLADVPLQAVAALTGRSRRAARLSSRPGLSSGLPAALHLTLPPLTLYSALGAPIDSIIELERRAEDGLLTVIAPDPRLRYRESWVARATSLAVPVRRSPLLQSFAGTGDDFVDATLAWAKGDLVAARGKLAALGRLRSTVAPENLSIDALYPEAWLAAQLGDTVRAMAWLDPALTAIARTAPMSFSDAVRAASLVRALALRAELAAATGDHKRARRFAEVVQQLWRDADAELQPVVQKMITIAPPSR